MQTQRQSQIPGRSPVASQSVLRSPTASFVAEEAHVSVLAEQSAAAHMIQRVWRGHTAREGVADRLWAEINRAHMAVVLDLQSAVEIQGTPEPEPARSAARDPKTPAQLAQEKSQPQMQLEPLPSWPEPEPEPVGDKTGTTVLRRQLGSDSAQVLELALPPSSAVDSAASPTTPSPRVTGVLGVRRRTPRLYPETLPEAVAPASQSAHSTTSEQLENSRLRSSVLSSPEAQRLRQLRDEGGRLVAPLQVEPQQGQLATVSDTRSSYARSPYARRLLQLRESHARVAAMQLHDELDGNRDLSTQLSLGDDLPRNVD